MTGRFIDIAASDGALRGYLAVPESGSGPGLVLLHTAFGLDRHMREVAELYAEEGYVVLCPDLYGRIEPGLDLDQTDADRRKALALFGQLDRNRAIGDIQATAATLRSRQECTGKMGVLGFCMGGGLAFRATTDRIFDCAVCYYPTGFESALALSPRISSPLVIHFAEDDNYVPEASVAAAKEAFAGRTDVEIYLYPATKHGFNRPNSGDYDKPAARMAHSRSLALMRKIMGPHHDLAALWEQHTFYEFGSRDVAATMRTMVAEPYVNHIPVMTGGVGAADLARFYAEHFIPKCPQDTRLVPISRTIGVDRLVDEMLFCFTHDIEIDWMLPGIPPTGRSVEIPLVAIVNFRGDKLYHEHIYWDQASVLVQIGVLDPAGLPIAGVETAKKLVDETLPSNTLMKR